MANLPYFEKASSVRVLGMGIWVVSPEAHSLSFVFWRLQVSEGAHRASCLMILIAASMPQRLCFKDSSKMPYTVLFAFLVQVFAS